MTEKVTRFGVSLESDLLDRFDRTIHRRHYTNRSQAIRDLIRSDLVASEWEDSNTEVIGTISMVYDHHVRGLTQRLTSLQHEYTARIVAATHVHMDHHNCLEVLVVRGRGREVSDLAKRIQSVKGVKHATLSMTTTGSHLK
jgi:CopG family transcriptional regulator, nickel-responsive regulator